MSEFSGIKRGSDYDPAVVPAVDPAVDPAVKILKIDEEHVENEIRNQISEDDENEIRNQISEDDKNEIRNQISVELNTKIDMKKIKILTNEMVEVVASEEGTCDTLPDEYKASVVDVVDVVNTLETQIEEAIVQSAINTAQNSARTTAITTPNASQNDDYSSSQSDVVVNWDNVQETNATFNYPTLEKVLGPIETLFKKPWFKSALTSGCGIAILNHVVPNLFYITQNLGTFVIKNALTSLSLLVVVFRTIGNDTDGNIKNVRAIIMNEIKSILHGLFNVVLLTQEIKQETMTEIHNFIVGLKNYEIHIKTTQIEQLDTTNTQKDELIELIEKHEKLIAEQAAKINKITEGGSKKSQKKSKKQSQKNQKKSKKQSKKQKKQGQKKSKKQSKKQKKQSKKQKKQSQKGGG